MGWAQGRVMGWAWGWVMGWAQGRVRGGVRGLGWVGGWVMGLMAAVEQQEHQRGGGEMCNSPQQHFLNTCALSAR
jgi:hypothetical protein